MLFGLAGYVNLEAEDAFAPDVDERRAKRDDALLRDERHPQAAARRSDGVAGHPAQSHPQSAEVRDLCHPQQLVTRLVVHGGPNLRARAKARQRTPLRRAPARPSEKIYHVFSPDPFIFMRATSIQD